MLVQAIFQRPLTAVQSDRPIRWRDCQNDAGLRSILQASLTSPDVLYAAIVDAAGTVIIDSEPELGGGSLTPADDLGALVAAGPIAQARAIYTPGLRTFEYRKSLLRGGTEFGSIRVGVSTASSRRTQHADADAAHHGGRGHRARVVRRDAAGADHAAADPRHPERPGAPRPRRTRRERRSARRRRTGGARRLVQGRERAARRRSHGAGRPARDARVGRRDPRGRRRARSDRTASLLFANPAMRPALGDTNATIDQTAAAEAIRTAWPSTTALDTARVARRPRPCRCPAAGERLLLTHVGRGRGRRHRRRHARRAQPHLSQPGRVDAQLLAQARGARPALGRHRARSEESAQRHDDSPRAAEDAARGCARARSSTSSVIAAQVRRLDEVVQGFLKFTRPEDLQLQPVDVAPLIEELMPVISRRGEQVRRRRPRRVRRPICRR